MKRNTFADKYLKAVKRELVCPHSLRKRSLDQLKTSLDEFLEDHPAATEADITEQFGSPADFANAFLASLDEEELKKQLKKSKRVWVIVIATCIIALLLLVLTFVKMIADNKKSHPVYITETIGEDPVPIDYGEGLWQGE